MKQKIKQFLLTVLFFLSLLLVLNIFYNFLKSELVDGQKNRYNYIAQNQTNYITNCIDKVVVRTYTLREMIVENSGDTSFFDETAKVVFDTVREDTGVTLRNVAVAPDGKVTKVYPLLSNETLIGFDFTDLSKSGNKEALEAYAKGKTIITNPFNLIQGGVGMGARTPVYVKKNDRNIFWGIVTATMDFDDFLKVFNLDKLNSIQCNYRLWYENDNRQIVVLDQYGTNFDEAVSVPFSIYNLKWHLDVMPQKGWYDANLELFLRSILILIDVLITSIVIMYLRIKNDTVKMKLLSEQDSLTHCYSRHFLNTEIIDIKTGTWKNSNYEYSIALVDIDNFLSLNESFGHLIGDRVLVAISDILINAISENSGDKIIRYDGDKFVMYLNTVSRENLNDRLSKVVKEVNLLHFDDIPELQLSVSIGATHFNMEESTNYNRMMQTAEENLMKVKNSGKNSVSIG